MHISKLLVRLEEEARHPLTEQPNIGGGAIPINYGPGEKEQVARNQVRAQPAAAGGGTPTTAPGGGQQPAPGQAPGQAVSNQIKISGPGGTNYIVGYVNASKAWAVYKQEAGAGKATLMPGPPLRTLAAAFTQVAAYF